MIAEDIVVQRGIKNTLRPWQGRKGVVTGQAATFRGTTLFRRCLATSGLMGANTPELYNGSSRQQLFNLFTVAASEGASVSSCY
jgi:hypothetical protein